MNKSMFVICIEGDTEISKIQRDAPRSNRRNRGKGKSRNRHGFKGFADELEDQNATPISALHPRGTSPGEP